MSAVPQLAAAVSNAGALGTLALTWSTPAGDVVRETAALTDRPFGGNLILSSDQHRRLDEALEAGMRIVSLMWALRRRGWVPGFCLPRRCPSTRSIAVV